MNWFRQFWDPRNPVQKFDHYQSRKPQRWVCGLSIDDDFSTLHVCLLKSSGAGKLIRLVPMEFDSEPIPESLQALFKNFADPITFLSQPTERTAKLDSMNTFLPSMAKRDAKIEDYFSIRQDLTSLAASLISRIVSKSGPANENILMVSVYHSGLYSETDTNGNWTECQNLPLIDSSRLAFQTGQNVLDRLPERQMSDGGSPWPLSGLPLWMLCADRREPVADTGRLVVEAGRWIRFTYLPPSNGNDGEFPLISQWTIPGLALLSQFYDGESESRQKQDPGHLAAQGKTDPELYKLFRKAMERYRVESRFQKDSYRCLSECFLQIFQQFQLQENSFPDLLQTYAKVVAEAALDFVERSEEKVEIAKADARKTAGSSRTSVKSNDGPKPPKRPVQWILSGEDSYSGLIANIAAARNPIDYSSVAKHGCPTDSLDSVVGATIGFFHIDQLPSSLPWISGCQSPRILGNLSPGSASHWRKLLLEMSDYRPPVMKLRDAV